ncbi:enoyl-CoA hydratase/isomerase family protein [Georgenia ruanii]|uniref:Enoyl-CoA hydratase/isomerase family protein n=2 Tax=Georgenia ruanii TaxID=348442 RepID=A0A7J9UX82_9MICO|nr:enoyl-CoA hydratase/isomerase family protein [Georgenia ruanii]
MEIVDLDNTHWSPAVGEAYARRARTTVLVGVSSQALPPESAHVLSALTLTLAPDGPGRFWVAPEPDDLDLIRETVTRAPGASRALASLLPLTAQLDVADALVAESLAYSMLLAGPDFRSWRAATPRREVPTGDDPVLFSREGDVLTLALNRPGRHNAFGRAVRDRLIEGLQVALLDESITQVELRGIGPSFCSGGDLDEFGTAPDVVAAHQVRLEQSAGLHVHRIRERVVARVHGACIGAGLEFSAFAARVEAREGAWFMLPELSLGLVPGAGGTVSVTRRIGRYRTAYMALTGRRIDLDTALAWGLVDAGV